MSKTSETRCKHCQRRIAFSGNYWLQTETNGYFLGGFCLINPNGRHEPTPSEGEAVTEQEKCARCDGSVGDSVRHCHACGVPLCDHVCEEWHLEKDCNNADAAPVVSTAAPEPPQSCIKELARKLADDLIEHGWVDEFHDGRVKLAAHIFEEINKHPVAPESYKPAEGPEKICGMSVDDKGTKCRKKPLHRGRCSVHPEPAATPVTVEAPTSDIARQIAICEENGTKWAHFKVAEIKQLLATPKPIGDVEAVAEQIAGPVLILARGMTYEGFREHIKAILSPFFAPAPPCSECATLQKQRESDLQHMQSEVSAAHSRAEKAELECATLRKELEHELLERTTQQNLAREARENWKVRAEAAEAQLSTLRDALEKGDPPTEEELAEWRREIGLSGAGPREAIAWLNEHLGVEGSNSLRESVTSITTCYRGHNIGARFVDREGKSWRLSEIMQAYAEFRAALAPTPEVAPKE